MLKNKFKASFIHLALSAVILSALISLIIIFWYPSPFLGVTNFKDIAVILVAIDLILGPLLTFIVYNENKKSLKFDLSSIVFVQVLALGYGLYMLYLSHPLYITFFEGNFNIITTQIATPEKAKYKNLQISKFSSPKLSYMDIANDTVKEQLFADMLNGEADIEARAEYYKPYDNNLDNILASSLDADKIFSTDNLTTESTSFLKKNKNIDNFAFLPLLGSSSNAVIVLNKETGKPIDTLKINPLDYAKKQVSN